MSEQAVLNPDTVWDQDLEDCMTPDYGFSRNRPATRAVAKPAGGQPYAREVTNTGHTFSLSWINRSFKCVQRVKRFYEQYEDGFFTLIDWDGGGRNYTGRFTGDYAAAEVANDKYTIQGLTFEEMPGAPMLAYPSDWDNDGVRLYALDDFGAQRLATGVGWATARLNPSDASTPYVLVYSITNAQGWATMEYRGYGFRLWMAKGPAYGLIDVQIDGTDLGTVDLYAPQYLGLQMVLERDAVPLDFHRVKTIALTGKNAAATASTVVWGFLEVMR